MIRFWIAYEGQKNEHVYDSKLGTITWTHSVKRTDGIEDGLHCKRLDDVNNDTLKSVGRWKPIGLELLDRLNGLAIIADVPTKSGDVYTEDEMKQLAIKDPDNWTYINGVLISTRR